MNWKHISLAVVFAVGVRPLSLNSQMYKNIPVEVEVLKGSTPDPLWEVFCQSVNKDGVLSVQFSLGLTRPSGVPPLLIMLPTGLYRFQVKKDRMYSEKIPKPIVGERVKVEILAP